MPVGKFVEGKFKYFFIGPDGKDKGPFETSLDAQKAEMEWRKEGLYTNTPKGFDEHRLIVFRFNAWYYSTRARFEEIDRLKLFDAFYRGWNIAKKEAMDVYGTGV